MKLYLFSLMFLSAFLGNNTVHAFPSSSSEELVYEGSVKSQGTFAVMYGKSCQARVSYFDTQKIVATILVDGKVQFEELVFFKSGNSYKSKSNVQNLKCHSDWARGALVSCQSKMENQIKISDGDNSEVRVIKYEGFRTLSELGGFDLSTGSLDCVMSLKK